MTFAGLQGLRSREDSKSDEGTFYREQSTSLKINRAQPSSFGVLESRKECVSVFARQVNSESRKNNNAQNERYRFLRENWSCPHGYLPTIVMTLYSSIDLPQTCTSTRNVNSLLLCAIHREAETAMMETRLFRVTSAETRLSVVSIFFENFIGLKHCNGTAL